MAAAKCSVHVSGQHLLAINGATFIPLANAVISVSEDKFVSATHRSVVDIQELIDRLI